jgi:hypothetical protein
VARSARDRCICVLFTVQNRTAEAFILSPTATVRDNSTLHNNLTDLKQDEEEEEDEEEEDDEESV